MIKKNISILFYSLYLVFLLFFVNSIIDWEYDLWLHTINLLIIVTIVIHIIISKLVYKKVLTFSLILVILSFVFHLSFPLVMEFGGKSASEVLYKVRAFDDDTFKLMITYALIYLSILFEGMISYELFRKRDENIILGKKSIYCAEKNSLYKLGSVLFIIFFPFDFISLIIKLLAMARGGYGESFYAGSSFRYYTSFCSYILLAAVFLIWENSSRKKSKHYLLAYIIYEIIWMFSGQRALPLVSIIIALWLYFGFGRKIRLKTFFIIIFGGIVGLILLNVIREFRGTGFAGLSIKKIFSFNIITDTLTEFGVTINVFGYVLSSNIDHNFGYGLIYNVLSIIPKVSWLGLDARQFSIYEALNLSSLGSSYLAEILFDFKQFGYVAVFLYGFFIRFIDSKIERNMLLRRYDKIIYYIPLVLIITFCVRTSTANILRVFIWTALLMYTVKAFLNVPQKVYQNSLNVANKFDVN